MSNIQFLDSEWSMVLEMIKDRPRWAEYAVDYPVPLVQVMGFIDRLPAPAVSPRELLVYLNGNSEASLVFEDGVMTYGDLEALKMPQQAIVIEADDVVRYGDIKGDELLNTLGDLILPDCMVNGSAMAGMILKLAQLTAV